MRCPQRVAPARRRFDDEPIRLDMAVDTDVVQILTARQTGATGIIRLTSRCLLFAFVLIRRPRRALTKSDWLTIHARLHNPVGQSMNSHGISNRLDKCAASAFTP